MENGQEEKANRAEDAAVPDLRVLPDVLFLPMGGQSPSRPYNFPILFTRRDVQEATPGAKPGKFRGGLPWMGFCSVLPGTDGMSRYLRLLFRRNPSRDRSENDVAFEGYEILWPDGRPVALGVESLCKHGQRLLGLGRHLRGAHERLVDMICVHLMDREADMTRLPGHRVRRFCLERAGKHGRVYFLDGTPTTILFDVDRDEQVFLRWLGLLDLHDGGRVWFDLAAQPVEPPTRIPACVDLPLRRDRLMSR